MRTHAGLASFGAFSLESILQQGNMSPVPVAGQTRIERGFIGAHADIGGGFGEGESQLAQVALAWMVKQATAAGVTMGDSSILHTIVSSPVIHDKSDSIFFGAPPAGAEDRQVRYRDGSITTQRAMVLSQGMSYVDTQRFINYLPRSDPARTNATRNGFVTGTVDMMSYLAWLNANGYDIDMSTP